MFKKLTALILAAAIALTLAACAGKTTEPAATAKPTTAPTPEPQAVISGDELDWGVESSDPDDLDTDHWYADGVISKTDYIMFDTVVTIAKNGAEAETYAWAWSNKHAVDVNTNGEIFDFVFPDAFTCYDYAGGQWYKRADYDAVVKSLTAAKFVCEADDSFTLEFNPNGTLVYTWQGNPHSGTWIMDDAHTIDYHVDLDNRPEGDNGLLNVAYEAGGWTVESIADPDLYYPEK